ncbi:MAG TPA: TonB-dependent receptor [bacterium]|nr:TonB-dependent receptor [bacterium]
MIRKTFYFLLTLVATISAQNTSANFTGVVSDDNGQPLPYANILITDNNRGTTTNLEGKFGIRLDPGEYSVVVRYIGYRTIRDKIVIQPGRTVHRQFRMVSTAIQLGEITVVADDEFIPLEPETKSVIRSGEIEHIQASSLNDVLQLAPGEKTTNPNLHYSAEAVIRGGNSIGTQVIMDGVPLSNNANMQIGIGSVSGNSGVDLRTIPAENVEEVEIIRGIPSARYGDLVDGILNVKTKAVSSPLRMKFKYNPHLYESNLSGGFNFHQWVFNGNINLALSERDVRVEGDGYTRIATQLTATRKNNHSSFKHLFYYTRTFDESKEKPGYALREAWYNRDYNIKYSTNNFFKFSEMSKIAGSFSVSYTRQNSYLQRLISRDNLVLSDRLTPGTQEGYIVFGSYLGKKWLKGEVWNFYGDLYFQQQFSTRSIFHTVTAGATWRNDFNTGKGVVFDPLYPPVLGTQAIRLRSYDELPDHQTLSLYAEDKITGRAWRPFTLQIGFRYEIYRPTGLWNGDDLIQSLNGAFLNPRFNFSVKLFEQTQIRFGYGVTSKSPPMGMIFPGIEYFDIVDTVAVVDPTDPEKNFSLISTYLRDRSNKNLKGYQQQKFEISLDQEAGPVGFTVTGFRNKTENLFRSFTTPLIFYKKSFPQYPDLSNWVEKDLLFESYNRYINDGWIEIDGLELMLKTKRLPVIETVFSFDAAYHHKKSGWTRETSGARRYSPELAMTLIPFYPPLTSYEKTFLFNYRFQIQAKSLGIWITLHIQQELFNLDGKTGMTDTLAIGYFADNGETVWIPEAERTAEQFIRLRRSYQPYQLLEELRPNLWLFNLKVSKSLWKGGEVSFYVNNFFNHRPFYRNQRSHPNYPTYSRRNPEIFFGMEVSSTLGVF